MREKIERILSANGIVVLDTNVYLNIYDRSPEFSGFSIKVLDSIKEKIYLPEIVKNEFLKNHRECYNRQKKKVEKACDNLSTLLNSTIQKVNSQCAVIKSFQFPDIDDIQRRIVDKINDAKQISEDYSDEHDILSLLNDINLQNDSVFDLFQWLIDNNHTMGELSIYEQYALASIADKRFEYKMPPGYKDQKKDYELGKYGDYFIWEQTIRFAKDNNLPAVFVTDDNKTDWFERNGDHLTFHTKLYDEFNSRVGTDLVGIDSSSFLSIVADIQGIEKNNATMCALEYTSDKYIESLVEDSILLDNLDELLYSSEKFVDMDSLSASATEGLEISDELENADFIKYEIGECNEVSATYYLYYSLRIKATSYEYWGRDSDTKEVITSPGRLHTLEGEVILEVVREVDDFAIVDGDSSYQSARMVSGKLKEIEAYDVEQLCSQCGVNIGVYEDYSGNPICSDCMKIDKYGEICTFCGRKVPIEYMKGDNICEECAKKYDS